MTPRAVRRRLLQPILALGLAVSLVITLGACTSQTNEVNPPPTTTAENPLPPGVAINDESIDTPVQTAECDTRSLRPPAEMPQPRAMPPRSTMDEIVKRGRLVVGTDLGSNPLSFRDPLSGDVKGFDIDIAHWISAALFGDPNRIDYRMVSTDNRIDALTSGAVDIVVRSMSITCRRLESIDFSVPYFNASQRILAYRHSGINSVDDLRGKRVCATKASTSAPRVRQLVKDVTFVSTVSWADCLVMLQQGQVDAITSDTPILAGIVAQDPWVQVVGESLGTEDYGVGVAKGHSDFVRFINGVLAERQADGSWQRAYQQWLSVLGPGSPPSYSYRD